jgi:pyrroline-5-carboxylate reductase
MNIGFIGTGKMATALIQGMLDSGSYAPENILAHDLSKTALEALVTGCGIRAAETNAEVAAKSDAVVLCVKPAEALSVVKDLRGAIAGKLLISIAAGIEIAALQAAAGDNVRVIRVMPNNPAQIHMGAACYASGKEVTKQDAELTESIFSAVGLVFPVKESLLDAVTGLSGSGPAYFYLVIDALADGGVLMGLPRELAIQLAAQTAAGAAQMVLQTAMHPGALRDLVASPGGTTMAGLEALENGAVRGHFIKAVRAATEKSRELGGQTRKA